VVVTEPSLNISGRTMIGNDNYKCSYSSFDVNMNVIIRNSTTSGSKVDIQVGLGSRRSYLSLEQDNDINLYFPPK
jgi:hypothetical protein